MDIAVLLLSMCFFFAIGMPIAYALALSSLVGALWIDLPVGAVMQQFASGVGKVSMLTIPFFVLAGAIMAEGGMARRLVDARNLRPFTDLSAVYQLLGGVPSDGGLLSLYPMDSGTLTMWSPQGGPLRVLHWTLTPFNREGRPWREDYEFALPQDDRPDAELVRTSVAKVLARAEAAPP